MNAVPYVSRHHIVVYMVHMTVVLSRLTSHWSTHLVVKCNPCEYHGHIIRPFRVVLKFGASHVVIEMNTAWKADHAIRKLSPNLTRHKKVRMKTKSKC